MEEAEASMSIRVHEEVHDNAPELVRCITL
jgi:hypothetical protein